MAEAFGMAPGNPVLAGLAGVLQGLPGGLNTFLQQRQAMAQRDEEQKRKGLQTLAEIMKLPRNMRGPMLGEVIKSGGVNATLGETLRLANEEQGQDIVAMLERGGVEDPQGTARLLETPDQAITMYNKAVEARRKREEDERLAKALGPGAGEAPQPETLGALVGPQPAPAPPAPGPPAGRAFASVPPTGRLDVDPSIGPPGAPEPMGGAMPGGGMPGGGMGGAPDAGDTLRSLLGARPPLMAAAGPSVPGLASLPFGGQSGPGPAPRPLAPPQGGAPVGPVVPPGGTIPPGAGPAPMPAADLEGDALKRWREYDSLTPRIEALAARIARVEAVGTEDAFKRADALRKDLDQLVKRQAGALTAVDKATPGWGDAREIQDPNDPNRTVWAQWPSKGDGPMRILGPAPKKPLASKIGQLQEDLARLREDPQKNAAAIAAAERELAQAGAPPAVTSLEGSTMGTVGKRPAEMTPEDWKRHRQMESDEKLRLSREQGSVGAAHQANAARAVAEAKKSVSDWPNPGERDKLTGDLDAIAKVDDIVASFAGASGTVGTVRGPIGEVILKVPGMTSDKERTLRTQVAALEGELLKLRSGVAVNPAEYARITRELPTMNDTAENFQTKLKQTQKNFRRLAQLRRDGMTATGVDVSRLAPIPSGEGAAGRAAGGPDVAAAIRDAKGDRVRARQLLIERGFDPTLEITK